jgi:hypothetical protein
MRTRQGGFDDGFMHESFWSPERTSANLFADWLTLTASKFETAQKTKQIHNVHHLPIAQRPIAVLNIQGQHRQSLI